MQFTIGLREIGKRAKNILAAEKREQNDILAEKQRRQERETQRYYKLIKSGNGTTR